MSPTDFKAIIAPFFWSESEQSASFCLADLGYRNEILQSRAAEGFEGNGYDWASLAKVFLAEKQPQLAGSVKFDPEGSMFCAYSSDKDALNQFALAFKAAVEETSLIKDVFSRAELD
ncbi:immunity 51 family protein [Hymenobacter sp. UYP22]|uniref:immunity 51 family protein n=1 Tax=Hymenobacter sp. UYP22 TaxID=3156348 RepID=UPI003395B703